MGGLGAVLEGLPANAVYASAGAKTDLSAIAGSTPVIALNKGDRLQLGDMTIQVCSAGDESLVILLERGAFSMLFTGDIETADEAELNLARQVTVLKVAHHGSDTSTSALLLNQIRPNLALISCDPDYYGHPSPEVLRRLEEAGASVFRTDACGAITLSVGGDVRVYTMITQDGV
ncbi:hypothetical protein SDC9_189280 [bioreactor metagenome]|uniref:ComE operon protein 3 n=1 Tax=bioreactor metagenome TaxID=1076179 RepID=A0A645HRP8_9ZZZZ